MWLGEEDVAGKTILVAADEGLGDTIHFVRYVPLLAARGARLLRLSPYSPDFNPIEQCWSKIKTCLRRAKARTVEALLAAVKEALDTITATDIRGWFEHGGYPVH